MITAVFSMREGKPCGFFIQGHSGFAPAGSDIVCSAVSSAVYLTANTLMAADSTVTANCDDGVFSLFAGRNNVILSGLLTHLAALSKQYPQYLRVYYLNLNGGK